MINAIKNGDAVAFEKVYKLYREKVFAFFLKKTNSAEDAKDLLQITFCKLWQYRKSLSEEYLPEQQLFYIARNAFIDYLRKENTLLKIKQSAGLNMQAKQSHENFYGFDLEARLQKVLKPLPSVKRTIFQLHKIEGYSYKEIAEILCIPIKSVDNHLAKTLKYLRKAELLFIILCIGFLR